MPAAQFQPLAYRTRPQNLDEYCGQSHLLAQGKPLRQAIESGGLHSMILWGPPGTGKTSLAHLLAATTNARIETLSAVLAGVKDVRAVVERAKLALEQDQQPTVLFVDEVHRFNKSQQDAFLPHMEAGLLTLIGATTENPSFALNNALLSRARVYVFKALELADLIKMLQQAIQNPQGLADLGLQIETEDLELIAKSADGDGRRALNILELVIALAQTEDSKVIVTKDHIQQALTDSLRQFDKGGDVFYEQISALHKSVRGSDPDAALYWLCRMLDGGCDPLYISRRVLRMASEDIGNADPRALELALNANTCYERLGSPEGELAIAQAVVYCACAAKSNAVYTAFKAAMDAAKTSGSLPVPNHLCNAPTKLMRELGYGKEYQYPHDAKDAYIPGETYLPAELLGSSFYNPVPRGLEIKIQEKLSRLKQLDENTQA